MSFEIPAVQADPAPPLQIAQWFNTGGQPIALPQLRGRVVALHAFQMLCPGCVAHGLPQTARLHELFPPEQLAVIGLHSVFEHHEVMGSAAALQAFIDEYRLGFAIGLDRPDPRGGPVPLTMQALGLRGTPSLILLDKRGRIRLHQFGRVDDLRLGALIGRLLAEPDEDAAAAPLCDDQGCRLPESAAQHSR
ncbi:peroxiredoxin family protein [Roseateles cavernae]|uniref:peroxiredoxin family protein n=1 Tax=Roseateles cavernae TaxID=3153578 RepID=UPI0032E36F05